jgi:hypothetical protein
LRAIRAPGLVLAATVVLTGGVSAHRLDECLQAARIAIAPDHVALELDVTPGAAVAETLIADIDRDGDGDLSSAEQDAYVRQVLGSIDLAVDDRRLAVRNSSGNFPDVAALRRGEGTIALRSDARVPNLPAGAHRVQFRNRYRSDVSVDLANALVPESDRVAVLAQHRAADQRELTIDYRVDAKPGLPSTAWLLGALAALGLFVVRQPLRARTAATRAAGPRPIDGTGRFLR